MEAIDAESLWAKVDREGQRSCAQSGRRTCWWLLCRWRSAKRWKYTVTSAKPRLTSAKRTTVPSSSTASFCAVPCSMNDRASANATKAKPAHSIPNRTARPSFQFCPWSLPLLVPTVFLLCLRSHYCDPAEVCLRTTLSTQTVN